MVRKKNPSKRITASKRYKIEKRVRQHNKKQRAEDKLKSKSRKPKADPGIPNLFPFKDKVLKEAEEAKKNAVLEKERQKKLRILQQLQNRNMTPDQNSLLQLASSAEKRNNEYESKRKMVDSDGTEIQDNSKKAYYKEFKKVIENADVILEVLDARDPYGCRSKQVEEMILRSGGDKKIILILNKIDLVPREVVEKWLKFLRNEYPTIAFKASTQTQRKNIGQASGSINSPDHILNSSECLGADSLMKLLKNYCRNMNIKTAITVGVIGFPNVGKSSLINSLKRSKVCNVGATAGVTKSAQEIHLDKNIKLLDCPGIVFASGKNQNDVLLLRNCLKLEQIEDPVGAVDLLLKRCNKDQIVAIYSTPTFENVNEFLVSLARQRGKLKKGGIADAVTASKLVLRDWNNGKIPYYVQPPKDDRMLSTTVVNDFSKEFSVEDIQNDDIEILKQVKTANQFGSKLVPMETSTEQIDIDLNNDGMEEDEDDEAPELIPATEIPEFEVTKKQQKKQQKNVVQQIKVNPDEMNLQSNKELKKLQKKMKKEGKKMVEEDDEEEDQNEDDDDNDDYDFETDFVEMEDEDGDEDEDDEEYDEDDEIEVETDEEEDEEDEE